MVKVETLLSTLTWNHDNKSWGFTHHYKEAPELGLFHTILPDEHQKLWQELIEKIINEAEEPVYEIGDKIHQTKAELKWVQFRLLHGRAYSLEAVFEIFMPNGSSHKKHIHITLTQDHHDLALTLHKPVYEEKKLMLE